MPDLKFAVLFTAIDQMSDRLGSMGAAVSKFADRVLTGSDSIQKMGTRMVEWGEKVGITSALLSEGANRLHEWSDSISEPAIAMQHAGATMQAMTGITGEAFDRLREHAIAYTNTHPGVTAEEWISSFTQMQGIFQDTGKAMAAADVTGMLNRLGVDSEAASRLIQVSWANLGVSAAATGDQITRAIQAFGLDPGAASQLAQAVGRLGASASAAHAPLSEVLALSGEAAHLLGGGRGAMMFASMINGLETAAAKGKATIDFSHGLVGALQQLNSQLSGTPTEKLAELHAMDIANPEQMLKLLDNLGEVVARQKQIGDSAGALGKAYTTATGDAADQTALLHQNVSSMFDAVYTPALQTVTGWLNRMTGATQSASGAMEKHTGLARGAALSLTAIGGGAYYGLQGLAAFGTMTAFAGKGVEGLGKLLDFQGHYLRALYAWDKISSIGSGIASFASSLWAAVPAVWSFVAGLEIGVGTIALAVGAVALLAVGAYELYEHWGAVSKFFAGVWREVKTIFVDAEQWMKNAGMAMIHALGDGILAGIEWPVHAAEALAHKIGGYFIGHSPPPYGPLHELGRITIAETIASRITAAPVLSAIGRTAGAIASAAPAMGGAAFAGAGGGIIHYAPVINGTGLDEHSLLRVLERHAYDLRRILGREDSRKERTTLK
jgi:hypothetical protein